ncbi:MAG: glycosyltransferase family 2 protein [bacterium]|nr:glycosyltransferase family 2 protein [bacterium]
MKVSIITPSYNQKNFIAQTIESVINQRGDFELEYIIIDGSSTDGSIDIIKKYAAMDARIKWLSEEDRGQSHAINKGLKMATGDIVAYLNSDDVYLKDALKKLVAEFSKQKDLKWLYGGCNIIDESGDETRGIITKYKEWLGKKYSYNKLLVVNFISQPAVFWRRDLLDEIGFINEDEHLVMDYEYWCRLGKKYQPYKLTDNIAAFRSYTDNKSSQGFVKQFKREAQIAKKYSNSFILNILHLIHVGGIIMIYKIIS